MSIFDPIKEKINRYIDVYIRLFKLNVIGHTANVVSYFIFAMITLFILFCVLLFVGLGITEIFVALGMSKLASLFITVGIYLLLLAVVVVLRRKITGVFASAIVRVMTEADTPGKKRVDEEDDE